MTQKLSTMSNEYRNLVLAQRQVRRAAKSGNISRMRKAKHELDLRMSRMVDLDLGLGVKA